MKKILLIFLLKIGGVFSQNFTAPFIKTVILKNPQQKGNHFFFLKGQKIDIHFDDLKGGVENYKYHLQHCDSDWNPSQINISDYVEGFDNGFINNYKNAVGTLQNYTHYQFSLPNAQTKIISSGNYILTIYKDFEEDFILKRKLVIYENKLQITAQITRANSDIQKKQMLTIHLHNKDFPIAYPQKELVVKILQNNDWNTCKTATHILFADTEKMTYRDDRETTFWGGNEFYFFDSKNLNIEDFQIKKSLIKEGLWHTFLYSKKIQKPLSYKFNPDIDGHFIVKSLNAFDAENQSDYTKVHFYLQDGFLKENENRYVYGNFNSYALENENKMIFDAKKNIWTATILLKQGFYNYKFVKKIKNKIQTKGLSGSFFQTQNTYTVVVYYKKMGDFMQKIIGVSEFK